MAACGGKPAPAPATTVPAVANQQPQPPVAAAPPAGDAVLAWPVAPFAKAQADEAIACDANKLAGERYPAEMPVDGLPLAYAPRNACDQAALAAACVTRLAHKDPPPACLDAYRAAVRGNPALVVKGVLLGGYFGKVSVVAPPPVAAHALSEVALDYKWSGLGDEVKWKLAITGGKATLDGKPKESADLPALIKELGGSLDSFVPMKGPLEAIDCTDNYPEWSATLTFDNGEKLEMSTHRSNLLGLGGPWQLTVDKITYVQLSPGFTRAVGKLVKALALPIGQPAGMTCRGFDLEEALLK
jgi:hypothetical protein